MVGAWLPSQIKLLNLHRQNALQANREKQETMQTTHSFDKRPNALSGFNAPKNKEGLVAVAIPTPHKHSLSCTTCKNKPTNRLQRPRKPNNSRMRQPINSKYHQLINSKTHQSKKSQAHQPINSQTHQLKNTSTHQLKNSSIQKLKKSSAHQPTNSLTHKFINSKNHQLKKSSTHQLKNLNCYFLFYNNTLIFAAF